MNTKIYILFLTVAVHTITTSTHAAEQSKNTMPVIVESAAAARVEKKEHTTLCETVARVISEVREIGRIATIAANEATAAVQIAEDTRSGEDESTKTAAIKAVTELAEQSNKNAKHASASISQAEFWAKKTTDELKKGNKTDKLLIKTYMDSLYRAEKNAKTRADKAKLRAAEAISEAKSKMAVFAAIIESRAVRVADAKKIAQKAVYEAQAATETAMTVHTQYPMLKEVKEAEKFLCYLIHIPEMSIDAAADATKNAEKAESLASAADMFFKLVIQHADNAKLIARIAIAKD